MFKNQQDVFQKDNVEEKFIIVYNKFTKPMAISIRNQMNNRNYSCVIWSEKTYWSNEDRLTTKNLLILLSEDVIKANLDNPQILSQHFSTGVLMKVEGGTLGLMIDPECESGSFKTIFKEKWHKYIAGIVGPIVLVGGLPGAGLITLLMFLSDRKRVQFRLMFDAVNKFRLDMLDDFMNGKLG
jgi:hypothetical protein